MCLRVGLGGLEKGGTVPIRSLLNTFVSTTHKEKQDGQAAAGRHTQRGVTRNMAPLLECSPPHKEKKEERWLP